MRIPTILTTAVAMVALTACGRREQSQSVPITSASPLVSTQRHWFILSEEIQNPEALFRGGLVRVQPDPVVPHGAMPTLEIEVQLPTSTPFVSDSIQEVFYFKGYAMGFLDAVFKRLICRSNAGDRLEPGWEQGWSDGYASATNRHDKGLTSGPLNEERTKDIAWEQKTVEKEFSPDPEKSKEQFKKQMEQFHQEGWIVLSVSKPLPQNDGTIRRKYELKRAKE